jgi:hypothetical protein
MTGKDCQEKYLKKLKKYRFHKKSLQGPFSYFFLVEKFADFCFKNEFERAPAKCFGSNPNPRTTAGFAALPDFEV